ncbi:spermatogenesis-associated serine-rich protein 1 [Heptranchias perlo]|uniref:spermatogenesis-associated serine-rich protein 1 n=1 Tax=Heptranchias perlo TaxID=212740 RepID=UPI00355A1DC4
MMTDTEVSAFSSKHTKGAQRRHFSHHLSCSSEKCQIHQSRGRLYIPHGYGKEFNYRSQVRYVEPLYSNCGLDWKSRLRWISEPHYSDAPHPDIKAIKFPEEVRLMRSFPLANRDSVKDWAFNFPWAYYLGKRCYIHGVYHTNKTSMSEISLSSMLGRKRQVIDFRNGLPETSPGDKPYRTPEYSPDFHKLGSTRPLLNFGGQHKLKQGTFIHLQKKTAVLIVPFAVKLKMQELEEEKLAVKQLNVWEPAPPLISPIVSNDVKKN